MSATTLFCTAVLHGLTERPGGDGKPVNAFALLIDLPTVHIDLRQDCELTIALYDAIDNQFISENYTLYWLHENRVLKGRQWRALFIDLGPKTPPHKVYLAIRVVRLGPMESASTLKKAPVAQETSSSQNCRQPYAYALCDVSDAFQPATLASATEEKQHCALLNRIVDDNFEVTLSKAVSGRLNTAKQADGVGEGGAAFAKDQLLLTTQVLLGSVEQIKKAQPHVFALHPPTLVRPMGFPDVIATDDVRNDLYVTLCHADLGHVTKSSDKNIEARLSLVDNNGKLVDDSIVIVGADGVTNMATYSSMVFYHDDKPKWFETVKICIPEDTSKDVHIRIAFRHRRSGDKNKAEKGPFAVAFLKLLEGTKLLEDGQHELLVYKIEANKFDEKDISYTYLPSSKGDLKQSQTLSKPQTSGFIYSDKSSFTVKTLTCSTSLTHNGQCSFFIYI
uniref:C2 DOCK-type domain-containing protein n=1 Tax=Plectus sambesii TaxID=2011161 RepID=A0A914WQX0_9BILA